MDQKERIAMLLKRWSELSKMLTERSIIIEDSVPYGSLEHHLEMEIQEMESILMNPPPVQVLWEVGLKKEHPLKYSLLNELGFSSNSFSVN